ncbi:MAG: energy transducer TonB [Saccharospirillaceae bacterium]|nr:energy transducer TonB [Pseudomonadales bacterium]NRB80815.1 energy transducer TonB [Saccharospirillaceae bacterium]
MNLKVLLFALLGAFLATVSLVWIMSILVSPKIHESEQKRKIIILATVDLVEPIVDHKPKNKEKPPEQPPISQPTPPKLATPTQAPAQKTAINDLFDFNDPQIEGLNTAGLAVNPLNIAPESLGQTPSFSRDAQVIVQVQPVYPISALKRNIIGFVRVDFIIDEQGRAKDIQIIESRPQGVFDRAVLKAVKKTKYQPVIENGKVIQVRVSHGFCFKDPLCM